MRTSEIVSYMFDLSLFEQYLFNSYLIKYDVSLIFWLIFLINFLNLICCRHRIRNKSTIFWSILLTEADFKILSLEISEISNPFNYTQKCSQFFVSNSNFHKKIENYTSYWISGTKSDRNGSRFLESRWLILSINKIYRFVPLEMH